MKLFTKHLDDKVFATKKQKEKEIWDVKGRLKKGNQIFKFDLSPVKKFSNKIEKTGYFKSKADKMVFENIKEWIIFDVEELHSYVKNKKTKDFNIDELINNLNWNLILPK